MPVAGLVSKLYLSLRPHGLEPAWLLCPQDFPRKNTGVGCHFLLDPEIKPPSPLLQADSLLLRYGGSLLVIFLIYYLQDSKAHEINNYNDKELIGLS